MIHKPNKIGFLKTTNDPRVCAMPKEVKRMVTELNVEVFIEPGFGGSLEIADAYYIEAGAKIMARNKIMETVGAIVSIDHTFGEYIKKGCFFIGIFNPFFHSSKLQVYDGQKVSIFSLDLLPRTTLAQSMDVLSSMASLAGYRSVLKAASVYNGVFPMFTTAAGTLTPVNVLVLGAGVAGLQAIATARRLGAVVEAFDVRTTAGEEVRSLGATFIEVEGYAESAEAGGYAVEQTEAYIQKQKSLIQKHIASSNIVISTANIPGRKAPLLIEKTSVEAMQPGSIIIDLAAEQGGNCELTKNKEEINYKGITIIGNSNLSAEIPKAASQLLSNNYYSFIKYWLNAKDEEDPLLTACKILDNGLWHHPHFKKELQTN